MRIVIKILIIFAATIIGLPAIFCIVLYGYSLYCNLNPDHVNLKKDGYVKIFSFITSKKKVLVEVYAMTGGKNSSGKFVIVRKGILPFGIKLVSTIVPGFCSWANASSQIDSRNRKAFINAQCTWYFKGFLGFYYNLQINETNFKKYWSQPSINFGFKWNICNNETTLGVDCKFCEEIPVLKVYVVIFLIEIWNRIVKIVKFSTFVLIVCVTEFHAIGLIQQK